jgi:hypothetical protein
MRTAMFVAACLLSVCFAVGCQKGASPARGLPAANTNSAAPSGGVDQDSTSGIQSTSDQPDDPGMSSQRDKTIRQELPSGDESSRAAPNEGDAEPPR